MLFTKSHSFMASILASIFLFTVKPTITEANQNTASTAHYFNTIQNNPNDLLLFLQNMPKGADLHNHLAGATYAENLLQDGAKDGFCLNPQTDTVALIKNCAPADQLANLPQNADLYNSVIYVR
jgi:adenosine deaminase